MGLGVVKEVANGTGHGTPRDDEGGFVGLGDIGEKVSGKGMAEFGIIVEKVSEVMEIGVRANKRGTTFGRGTTSTIEGGEGRKTGFVGQLTKLGEVSSEDSSDSSSIGGDGTPKSKDETPKNKEFQGMCTFNGNISEVSQESQTRGSEEETPLKVPGNPKIDKHGRKGTTFNEKMNKKPVDKVYHNKETVQFG
jgi:hypothetical protein